jgi:type VI secretion system protein ImpH
MSTPKAPLDGDTDTSRAGELAAVYAALRELPHAHDFFALLRRVEGLHPQFPRFGRALRPSQEALRLGQEPEFDFAPAALATFDMAIEARGGAAPRLGVRFFGLLGPQGPMPLHLTEFVRERLRYRNDPTPARFLDIFHHRLLTLFYRTWAQSQPAVQHDRPRDDRYAVWLGAICGLSAAAHTQGTLSPQARLFQAGLLGSRSRHPEGLMKLLSQYFAVPVRIEQNVAHWLPLEEADRSRLGHARNRAARGLGVTAALGSSATAGRRVRDRQYKFRIALGPLTMDQYRSFLPGGEAWLRLRDWVCQYAGLDMLWDVQLCLARAELPAPRLGSGLALGVATWVGRSLPHDRADLRLRPDTSFLLRQGALHA